MAHEKKFLNALVIYIHIIYMCVLIEILLLFCLACFNIFFKAKCSCVLLEGYKKNVIITDFGTVKFSK